MRIWTTAFLTGSERVGCRWRLTEKHAGENPSQPAKPHHRVKESRRHSGKESPERIRGSGKVPDESVGALSYPVHAETGEKGKGTAQSLKTSHLGCREDRSSLGCQLSTCLDCSGKETHNIKAKAPSGLAQMPEAAGFPGQGILAHAESFGREKYHPPALRNSFGEDPEQAGTGILEKLHEVHSTGLFLVQLQRAKGGPV